MHKKGVVVACCMVAALLIWVVVRSQIGWEWVIGGSVQTGLIVLAIAAVVGAVLGTIAKNKRRGPPQ